MEAFLQLGGFFVDTNPVIPYISVEHCVQWLTVMLNSLGLNDIVDVGFVPYAHKCYFEKNFVRIISGAKGIKHVSRTLDN